MFKSIENTFSLLFNHVSFKYLKLFYTILYFHLCILIFLAYVIINFDKYHEIVNPDDVDTLDSLKSVLDLRGANLKSKIGMIDVRFLIKKTGKLKKIHHIFLSISNK
jgi:hypothetical protein